MKWLKFSFLLRGGGELGLETESTNKSSSLSYSSNFRFFPDRDSLDTFFFTGVDGIGGLEVAAWGVFLAASDIVAVALAGDGFFWSSSEWRAILSFFAGDGFSFSPLEDTCLDGPAAASDKPPAAVLVDWPSAAFGSSLEWKKRRK